MFKAIGTAALLLLGVVAPAYAQSPDPSSANPAAPSQGRPQRIWVNFNGASTTGSQDFGLTSTIRQYDEDGSFETTQQVTKGATIDVSALVRVWRGVLVGAGYSGLSSESASRYTLTLPHPLYYNQPRTATGEISSISYKESSVNLILAYTLPLMERLDVTAMAGPTFFKVQNSFVTGIRYSEVAPSFANIPVDEVTTASLDESATGMMIGGDVTYMFTQWVGAGAFVRYNAATLRLKPSGGGESTDLDLGGFQWGGGIRVRLW